MLPHTIRSNRSAPTHVQLSLRAVEGCGSVVHSVVDVRSWLAEPPPLCTTTWANSQVGNPPPWLVPHRVADGITWVTERAVELHGHEDFVVGTWAACLADAFRELDYGNGSES